MKLTGEDKYAASVAILRGDQFTRGHALLFSLGGPFHFCVMQTIGSADTCKKTETYSWAEAIAKFEEYAEV
jgi:hypothetical protein